MAARLEFSIDQPILDAIAVHRHEIARSAAARLLEEYYKILRSGHAADAMRQLRDTRLMKEITPELSEAPEALWSSLAALDAYRARFAAVPDSLTNAILVGMPLASASSAKVYVVSVCDSKTSSCTTGALSLMTGRSASASVAVNVNVTSRIVSHAVQRRVEIGMLPIARRDVERLQHIISMQARLADINAPMRAQRALLHRSTIDEAITWLEIHGERPEVVAHWRGLQAEGTQAQPHEQTADTAYRPRRRRRRRRRPRFAAPQE